MSRQLFASVKKWRAADQHTGIDKDDGVPYTYEHLEGRRPPLPRATVYRVETYIPFTAPTALHHNTHYVPGTQLDRFVKELSACAETVIDIRPLSSDEAIAELGAFRARGTAADDKKGGR